MIMKKIFETITNPTKMIPACLVWFAIALIDSLIQDAGGFSDLTMVGKISISVCMTLFAVLMVKYLLYPVVMWIVRLIK